MEVIRLKEQYFACNTYIIVQDGKAIIIDAGASYATVNDALSKLGYDVDVVAILLTHSHFDHIYGLDDYLDKFNCKAYIDGKGIENLNDTEMNYSKYYGDGFTVQSSKICQLPNQDECTIDDFKFRVVRTYGHTNDSVCYIFDDIMFSGDTVFSLAVGRTDLPNSNIDDLHTSLSKLRSINPPRIVYPGHGRAMSGIEMDNYIDAYIATCVK